MFKAKKILNWHKINCLILAVMIIMVLAILKEAYIQTSSRNFKFVIPIYNKQGLEVVTNELKDDIRPNDIFLIISGNFSYMDLAWVNSTAKTLKNVFPENRLVAGTNGLNNLEIMARSISSGPIEAIAYIYEPNSPFGTEFTWDFEHTLSNFKKSSEIASNHNKRIIAKPTGRPILRAGLQHYNWDYSMLGNSVDFMFIQTQTYCKNGPDVFIKALNKIEAQYLAAGLPMNWYPEVSIDPSAPNGVPVKTAVHCAQLAKKRQMGGILVWWSPAYKDALVQFLRSFRK
jgi:hypothetical protein